MYSDDDEEFTLSSFSKRKNVTPVSSVLKEVIQKCERQKPKQINIMSLSVQHQGNHRRLYELFNLLTYFGVTINNGRGKLSWFGFSSLLNHIENTYLQLESKSNSATIQNIFQLETSPHLGQIAEYFMILYPFLNVNLLNIKSVSTLFSYGVPDKKQIERRMYLALSLLETIGCIKHKPRSGQYKLVLDVSGMVLKAKASRDGAYCSHMLSIDYLLNHPSKSAINDIYAQRQFEFERLTKV
ncbi:hypothetical protein TVAG_254860 [Trichomonas vaginalis G3]|uniref:E2F/DP family winged-helix DNA-binding domain-containing protein n=1 Tax=Trichomonas vaginalis (strain ATCC PRA-98 / G3) TaxID=412133 RepID=A2EXM8_TRIV3|nr:hypothetical protein TVAGG3_0751390 [Trichomonas vaginalis G3]EAY02585.1 hypothetical protein TVAG_254860 [Trichomonas vaginalis G3]KAI5512569.1 hypothetical protein TVAGG3_0751390 [Trichomonas vaginalis G3]|eukprot:XP_001314808.1 hypothetical protein [Trichomonas vaginalis G3]